MGGKIKTSILIDRELWEKFREKVASEYGLKYLSKAVEEAIEEELAEIIVLKEIEESLPSRELPLSVTPVKPKVRTRAEDVVRELRGLRS